MVEMADVAVCVPSDNTQHIQEAHLASEHVICHLVERALFGEQPTTAKGRGGLVDLPEDGGRKDEQVANLLHDPLSKGGNDWIGLCCHLRAER